MKLPCSTCRMRLRERRYYHRERKLMSRCVLCALRDKERVRCCLRLY
ncbi:hypothetical protein [Vibrio sp. 1982]